VDRRFEQLRQAGGDDAALIPGFLFFAYWYLIGAFAFLFIGAETRGRTIDEIDREMNSQSTRSTEVVSAVCGITGAVLSVAVMPFAPLALLIAVGLTVIAPMVGGVLMLAGAVGVLYFALTTGGLVVLILGLATTALTAIAGIASLMTPHAKPVAAIQHATSS
jgi:hypothetical protein